MTIRDAIMLGYAIGSAEWEIDACSPLDDGVIDQGLLWLRMYQQGLTQEHSGDCTNEAHTCLRCHSEVVREMAEKAMLAAQSSEGSEKGGN